MKIRMLVLGLGLLLGCNIISVEAGTESEYTALAADRASEYDKKMFDTLEEMQKKVTIQRCKNGAYILGGLYIASMCVDYGMRAAGWAEPWRATLIFLSYTQSIEMMGIMLCMAKMIATDKL